MQTVYDNLEAAVEWIVKYAILLIDFIGMAVLLYTVVHVLISSLLKKRRQRLELVEGISFVLELIMGGELLRTIVAREWSELLILGAIILIRAALSLLIHWEIREERRHSEAAQASLPSGEAGAQTPTGSGESGGESGESGGETASET